MRLTRRGRDGDRPALRVFLHLGAPVTGTPYLRDVLSGNRRRLARAGVLYPSDHVGAGPGHPDAILDVLDLTGDGRRPVAGAWDRLAQAARDWRRGTVVVSHELLADADDTHVQRVLASLGGAEVHVVYAVRDLARQLPLAWQEWVRNGGTAGFGTYVDRVAGRSAHRVARVFWSSHDLGRVLDRWAAYLPADRVHVLTVPDGPDQHAVLWERFAGALGIGPRVARAADGPGPRLLSHAGLECLRLLNAETGRPAAPEAWAAVARLDGPPPALPAEHRDRLRAETDRMVAAVKDGGYDVVGDLTDLDPAADAWAVDDRQVLPRVEDVLTGQTRLLATLLTG